jgi:hypothetical protein
MRSPCSFFDTLTRDNQSQSHNTVIILPIFARAIFKKMNAMKYNEIKRGGCVDTNLTDSRKNLNPSLEVSPCQQVSKSKRTVSFAAPTIENEIYEIPHINDYSSALIESIWYNDADYQRIQNSCIKIIRKMNSDAPVEKVQKYCSRGLERFTEAGALACRTNRAKAREAVLEEQELQWRDDVFEPAGIADIYVEHCLVSKIDAINTARRDELKSK